MPEVFVGLGSNESPEERLRAALERLRELDESLRVSSVYRSNASGVAAPDYWNAAVRLVTAVPFDELAVRLADIERACGRTRPPRVRGICELDLDVLLYGMRVDPARRLPRGDVLRARYVLAPLAEVAPGLHHPVTGELLGAAWERRRTGAAHERVQRLTS
jgi:2-amino-4-hydroxy-6-hydroxymethyldihydropteridine diphosphokinase